MAKFSHVKTWLFDLDDTLYAPETGFSKYMANHQRATLAKLLNTDIASIQVLTSKLIQKYGGAPFTGLHQEGVLDMDAFIDEGFRLDHGKIEKCEMTKKMLLNISGRKVVFTNSPKSHADNILKTLEYQNIFSDEHIFDVTRLEFETKPLKSSYEKVLVALNEVAEHCILVEDSLKNLEMAKSMGMTTVSVYHNGEKPNYVDYAYLTLKDFLQDVENENKSS